MAIYNVNKTTGDITETAGKYGSSSNVFYGNIASWNNLTTEEKKTYDHASITDSISGGVTFPANKVVMNSGDSVQDVLGSLIEVNKSISALACSTAWGQGFITVVQTVDISSLNLQNAPSVLGIAYTATNTYDALPFVENVTNTAIRVGLMRLTASSNLTGRLNMIIRSNG